MDTQRPIPSVRPLRPHDPKSVAGYELLGRIGEGGMGAVFLGRSADGATVAIKVVRPELAGDAAFIARFHSEVAAAERVASFSTAQVLDHGESESGTYLVTEYIDGPSLGLHIAEHGALSAGLLHGVAVGVAAALVAIHGAGLIHRDLKPANVLLSLSGPRVIDFGIARALDEAGGLTMTGQLVGSPGWIAPEQIRGEEVTTAVDIFTWGCLVAYAGSGVHPFGAGDFTVLAARIVHGEPDPGPLTPPLDRLVRAALAKDPRDRPTAQELLLALVGGSTGALAGGAGGVGGVGGADGLAGAVGAAGAVAEAAAQEAVREPDGVVAETIADSWRPEELAEGPAAPAMPPPGPAPSSTPPPGPFPAEAPVPAPPPAQRLPQGWGSPAAGPPTAGRQEAAPTLPSGQAGPPGQAVTTVAGGPPDGRRRLVAGGAALALLLVAVPLAWFALNGEKKPSGEKRPPAEPAALPRDSMLVRMDRKAGWPVECHGNIGVAKIDLAKPGGNTPNVLLPGNHCDILPHLSSDRKQIAFTRVLSNEESQLWVMRADGVGGPRRVKGGDIAGKTRVTWSKDGRRIAFMKKVDGRNEIYAIAAKGGTPERLTNSAEAKDDPIWSPDGSRIAFWAKRDGIKQIFTLQVNDPAAPWHQVTHESLDAGDPVWSPDGSKIAYTRRIKAGDQDIHVIDTSGPGRSVPLLTGSTNDMDPNWSPDGKWIAYVRGDVRQPCVWGIRSDGSGDPQRLTPKELLIGHPNWT